MPRLKQVKNTRAVASCLSSCAQHLQPCYCGGEEVGTGVEQLQRAALGHMATAQVLLQGLSLDKEPSCHCICCTHLNAQMLQWQTRLQVLTWCTSQAPKASVGIFANFFFIFLSILRGKRTTSEQLKK